MISRRSFLIDGLKITGPQGKTWADLVNQPGGAYAAPALVEMPGQSDIVRTETFAPIQIKAVPGG